MGVAKSSTLFGDRPVEKKTTHFESGDRAKFAPVISKKGALRSTGGPEGTFELKSPPLKAKTTYAPSDDILGVWADCDAATNPLIVKVVPFR